MCARQGRRAATCSPGSQPSPEREELTSPSTLLCPKRPPNSPPQQISARVGQWGGHTTSEPHVWQGRPGLRGEAGHDRPSSHCTEGLSPYPGQQVTRAQRTSWSVHSAASGQGQGLLGHRCGGATPAHCGCGGVRSHPPAGSRALPTATPRCQSRGSFVAKAPTFPQPLPSATCGRPPFLPCAHSEEPNTCSPAHLHPTASPAEVGRAAESAPHPAPGSPVRSTPAPEQAQAQPREPHLLGCTRSRPGACRAWCSRGTR